MNELEPNNAAFEALPSFRGPSRPVFGPSLWIFGATLWAYVVAGELVVNLSLPEPLAVLGVLGTAGLVFRRAMVESRREDLAWTSQAVPLLVAFALLFATLFLAVGLSLSGLPGEPLTVALWFVAAFAVFSGRHRCKRPASNPTSASRLQTVALWVLASLATLIALGSTLSQM